MRTAQHGVVLNRGHVTMNKHELIRLQVSILVIRSSAMVPASAYRRVTHTKATGHGAHTAIVTVITKENCVKVSYDVLHPVLCEPIGIHDQEHQCRSLTFVTMIRNSHWRTVTLDSCSTIKNFCRRRNTRTMEE